jgi:hypothetical protein
VPKFMLSVWHDKEYVIDFSSEEMQRIGPQVGRFNDQLVAADELVFGDGLMPASTSVVYRLIDGVMTSRPGPYTPGQPHIGGFWVIDVADAAAAAAWADLAAAACEQPVELRPFQPGE